MERSMSQKGPLSMHSGNEGLCWGAMFALERVPSPAWGRGRGQGWLGFTHCGSFGSLGASRSL